MPVGHYEPGYMYGNPKTHKNEKDPPLRPIISQLGTPTYMIAKKLSSIIVPYMPKKYMLNSSQEFIELIRGRDGSDYLASLDVDNLFTNVPVEPAINFILDNVYNNEDKEAPDIPRQMMKSLLLTCCTETPFRHVNGDIYIQRDGVSMGSPLGPTLANYYMCYIENNVLPTMDNPPVVYARYVDDVFILTKNIQTLHELKEKFETSSVLRFTFEIEKKQSLAFLDVRIIRNNGRIHTEVYVKYTDNG